MRFADSADDNDKLGGGTEKYKTKIAINSNGSCKWMAPAIFQSTCDINTEFFPFDDQVRQLVICMHHVKNLTLLHHRAKSFFPFVMLIAHASCGMFDPMPIRTLQSILLLTT